MLYFRYLIKRPRNWNGPGLSQLKANTNFIFNMTMFMVIAIWNFQNTKSLVVLQFITFLDSENEPTHTSIT